jgi:NAD(P)H-flavin reductase
MVPLAFRVSEREQDTADTWTLTLEPVSGIGPAIRPGQFMMVTAFGFGEVPISVSGPPNRPGPVVLTVRAVGAVSRAICDSQHGALLGLRGPFGNDWPVDGAVGRDLVVIDPSTTDRSYGPSTTLLVASRKSASSTAPASVSSSSSRSSSES